MEQDIVVKKEIPSWDEIREYMYETSRMMREEDIRNQAEREKRQAEYVHRQLEYERMIREAEQRHQEEPMKTM